MSIPSYRFDEKSFPFRNFNSRVAQNVKTFSEVGPKKLSIQTTIICWHLFKVCMSHSKRTLIHKAGEILNQRKFRRTIEKESSPLLKRSKKTTKNYYYDGR